MPSRTWTPDALSSERRRLSGRCWRAVEAQHRVSTMKLVDTLAEQAALEDVLERTKPAIPAECRHLHYLVSTPFRYGAPYPHGSRFRRPGLTPGVYYGSRTVATTIAEVAFHRLLFFGDSPETPWPANPGEFTAFAVDVRTRAALDLQSAPLDEDEAAWTSHTDYGPCQDLADAARLAAVDVLVYASVRDPRRGANLAVLACRAFASREPIARQTWRLGFGQAGVRAVCGAPTNAWSSTGTPSPPMPD
ncbi:MAG: RES family NAD+ phosphorylase [Vicinamibacterales bacterium]